VTTRQARAGVLAAAVACAVVVSTAAAEKSYQFAGSVQLDYLAVPTEPASRATTLDGTTIELSLKLAMDFTPNASATVKTCFACHGFELGMAHVDLRVADELVVRIGRMTPSFGSFPARHDPANHRTSDKPLVYDMGRMLQLRAWNEGVLPAPWVDNGVEARGTFFFEQGQLDYAAFLLAGPKAGPEPVDFDFILSRSPAQYYVDNNSRPIVGGRLGGTLDLAESTHVSLGASGMWGHYDPEARRKFWIAGADVTATLGRLILRGEYLVRRTQMALGSDPASRFKYGPGPDGEFADYFVKDGFYAEAELGLGRLDLVGRFDGLRRKGNVLATSALSDRSTIYRSTLAAAIRVDGDVRIKTSFEHYAFSDFADELAIHLGVATAF
jgi:hypothetical protein